MVITKLVGFLAIFLRMLSTTKADIMNENCVITDYSQVSEVVSSCTDIVVKTVFVPAGKTLEFNLQTSTTVTIRGAITFGVAEWTGPLVNIEGKQVKVFGNPGVGFDGQGSDYWDGKGDHGTTKPVLLRINVEGGEFYNFNLFSCPLRCTSINGSDIFIDGWKVDVLDGNEKNLGVNTVGFDVTGENITIKNTAVWNQDDCIVVTRGSNMNFENNYCFGGHGLSVEAGVDPKVYANNIVTNITYTNSEIENSQNAIHVRTIGNGGPGLIENLTFNRITMSGIKNYGIRVHQDYPADDKKPKGNVVIRDLKMTYITGTMTGNSSVPVNVLCASQACSDWTWSDITITGNSTPCSMNYIPSGFSC